MSLFKKIKNLISKRKGMTEVPKVKIKLDEGVSIPVRNGEWYDLAVAVDTEAKAGEMLKIDLGCAVKPPRGYYVLIASRSSTPLKHGLIIANGIGIVERNYCGNDDKLGFVAYATRDVSIKKGTRIAQMTIVPYQTEFAFDVVDEMEDANRGGWGSTGL